MVAFGNTDDVSKIIHSSDEIEVICHISTNIMIIYDGTDSILLEFYWMKLRYYGV